MRIYWWAWAVVSLVAGAVPVAIGVVVAPVAVFCIGALTATVVAASGWRQVRVWCGSGLLGAAAVAVLSSSGAAGAGLLALVAATSPPVVARVTGLRRRSTARVRDTEVELGSVLTADLLAGPVHALDDRALCRAWSESFVAVKLARTGDERLELVNLRQAYLDELEARNEFGFHAWLRSGARPIGNPARFLELHEDRPSDL